MPPPKDVSQLEMRRTSTPFFLHSVLRPMPRTGVSRCCRLHRPARVREIGWAHSSQNLGPGFGETASGSDVIRKENAKPGTRDWMLTKTSVGTAKDWFRSRTIEGYCSETSVRAGDTLKVMVSANPVSEFDLEIFRTGYYGGTGARSMKKFTSLQGKTQPDAEIGENRQRECTWEPSVEFEIPKDWVSLFPFSLAYPPATACIHSAILG